MEPEVAIACVSNVFIRQMSFGKVGDREIGHSHPFDHVTFLAHGSLRITVQGETRDFKAPQMILIRKDQIHELVALEDNTQAACIHALRDGVGEGDIVPPDAYISDSDKPNLIKALRTE